VVISAFKLLHFIRTYVVSQIFVSNKTKQEIERKTVKFEYSETMNLFYLIHFSLFPLAIFASNRESIDKELQNILDKVEELDDFLYKDLKGKMLSKSEGGVYNPEEVLESEQCSSFLNIHQQKIEDLLKYSDDVATTFLCNVIEREKLIEEVNDMEDDLSSQNDPCIYAVEKLILEQKKLVIETLSSESKCIAEVTKEIAEFKDEHRSLSTTDRKLWRTYHFSGLVSLLALN